MGARPGEALGIIYGHVEATEFRFAASDPGVKRLDYVSAEHPNGLALGQIVDVERNSTLSFEEAVQMPRGSTVTAGDYVSCKVRVVGYRDERGLLQSPRTPFTAGTEVRRASANLIQRVLGLTSDPEGGVYLGYLKGTESPVVLDINLLVQKHVSVLAKTGAGKSYTVGVLIEELMKRRVPLLIIDAHGEYTTLGSPNIEPREIDNLIRFNLKPKSFATAVHEYALEKPSAGRKQLHLEGTGLDAREIIDLLPGKLSPAQSGLLYQAINDLRRARNDYSFRDVIDELGKNPSNAKWPLVGSLETLETTGLFAPKGTGADLLVVPGQCAIVNLKGTAPEVQQICVARLATMLFEARKKNKIPPFMFVVEEAHNYCPERTISSALSGQVLRTIASEGRKFGMGLLIVSQRPAKVDKNVLSQCNTQIIMKVTNPNDLRAITASVEGLTTDTADEIQRLDIGVAMVAAPGLAQPILVEVRTRQTKHGGRSVDVLASEEPEEPEPEVRVLPPAAVVPADLPPIEHVLRAAHEAPVAVAEASLGVPVLVEPARPWIASAPEPSVPLYDGEPIEDAEPVPAATPVAPPVPPKGPRLSRRPPETTGAEPPAPELRPSPEPDDVLIQRVLTRIGYTVPSAPEAVRRVRDVARTEPLLTGDDYVRGYARIGRTYCFPAYPECGPCPLLGSCRLGQQRLAGGEVRAGKWGRPR